MEGTPKVIPSPNDALVQKYISAWLAHDSAEIDSVVSDDCAVIESDGTRYLGRKAIRQWVDRWIRDGNRVEQWQVTQITTGTDWASFEWQFTCLCCGIRTSFPGASFFKISNGKISSIVEYRRKFTATEQT